MFLFDVSWMEKIPVLTCFHSSYPCSNDFALFFSFFLFFCKDKKRAFDELIVDFKRTMHKSDRLSVTRTSHKYLMDVTYKM